MRTANLALVLLAATMTLAACSAPTPTPTTPSATAAPTPTEADTAQEPVAPSADDDPPAGCVDAPGADVTVAEGGTAIAAAVGTAELPNAVVLHPGVDVVASEDQAGLFDVIVGVCSEPLPRRALIAVANEIALAIAADASSDLVATISVTGWSDAGGDSPEEGETVRTDFAAHSWDPGAAVPLSRNWE
jgi:hypothetical protein